MIVVDSMPRSPDFDRRVDVIDWKLIGSCNLRCGHCYGPPKTEKSLPLPILRRVVDRFAELRPEWIVLTGGEPLMVRGIDEIMERITESGTKVALSTNTTLFRKYQDAIEQHVASLNIPLDGSTPEIHALQRGGDTTTYDDFFDVLHHYQAHPADKPELLRVGTVYSAATRGDLGNIAQVLEPFADIIDRWKIYELIDYEIQRDLREPLIHEPGDFEQEISELVPALDGSALVSKMMVSSAGARDKAYFMVNPRGVVVMPTHTNSVSYEVPIGHILDDPLPELLDKWSNEIEPTNYYGNHTHYKKNKGDITLQVIKE